MFNIIDYTEYMFHINLLGSLVPTEKKASSYPILLKFHNSSVFKLGVKTFHLILILEYSHLHLVHSQPTCFSNFNFRELTVGQYFQIQRHSASLLYRRGTQRK